MKMRMQRDTRSEDENAESRERKQREVLLAPIKKLPSERNQAADCFGHAVQVK